MEPTVDLLIEASHYPLSVIIIGVGPASFSAMIRLDSDEGLLKSTSGRTAMRDMVQFVPFRDFKALTMEDLSREVLKELPRDLVEYFMSKGTLPQTADGKQIEEESTSASKLS